MASSVLATDRQIPRFGLLALFECVTLCAAVAGLQSLTGVAASFGLMGLAVFLRLGMGLPALGSFVVATALSDSTWGQIGSAGGNGQFFALLLGAAICAWCLFRSS